MSVYLLGYVTIFVSDLGRATVFYRDLLGIKVTHQDEKRGVAMLDTEGAGVILQQVEANPEQAAWVGRNTGISLTVQDLEARINILESRGVRFLHPPKLMFWGKFVAPFCDPDGNRLNLVG